MFELQKGDSENLEGKVVVWVENLQSGSHDGRCQLRYASFFAATDAPTLISWLLNEKKSFGGVAAVHYFPDIPVAINSVCIGNISLLENIDGDVINGGFAASYEKALQVLYGLTAAYMINYHHQQRTRKENIRSYKGDVLEKLTLWAGGLLDAIQKGDSDAQECIVNELQVFFYASLYRSDLNMFIETARGSHPNKVQILATCVRKIVAVRGEDYKKAGELKRELEDLVK